MSSWIRLALMGLFVNSANTSPRDLDLVVNGIFLVLAALATFGWED